MCGLDGPFAEHTNMRLAASFDLEAFNFGAQTTIADSIERFAQMVIIDELIRADVAFATFSSEVFPHIRKAHKIRTDIIIDETANAPGFFFGVMKVPQAVVPNSAACAHKITIQRGELFFAQVRVTVAQLLVFCRVSKLAAFARFWINKLVEFFGGNSEHL